MARNLDRMTIFALSCAVVGLVIALLWRKAKDSENTGGASPEFINKINKQTDEGNERLNWKKQADKASTRIGE